MRGAYGVHTGAEEGEDAEESEMEEGEAGDGRATAEQRSGA